MTDQVSETPVEEVEATAATPETVETPAPETEAVPEETKAQADEKTFTQDELNTIIQKEKAKAEARAERRALKVYAEKLESMQSKPAAVEAPAKVNKVPKLSDYENAEDYVEAAVEHKLQQHKLEAQSKQAENSASITRDRVQKIFANAEKNADFDRDTWDSLPLDSAAAFAILDSDVTEKLLVHFVQNPDEAERIYKLSPARQAAEIGKMEVKLSESKPVKASSAPAPIKPIGQRGTGSVKDPNDMSQADFEKWLYKRA